MRILAARGAAMPAVITGISGMLDVDQIKQRRLKLGLKMELAARRAGFSGKLQWYLIESGRRTDVALSTLDKLAKALECEAKDLLK